MDWLLGVLAGEGLPYAGGLATADRPRADGHRRDAPGRDRPRGAGRRARAVVARRAAGRRGTRPVQGLLARRARRQPRAPVGLGRLRGSRPACAAWPWTLPDLAGRRNLNALHLAARFDDPATRADDIDRLAAAIAVGGSRRSGSRRPAGGGRDPRPRRGLGRAAGRTAARAVRGAPGPAVGPRHPPVRRPARADPRRSAAGCRSARRSRGSGPRATGSPPWSWRPRRGAS